MFGVLVDLLFWVRHHSKDHHVLQQNNRPWQQADEWYNGRRDQVWVFQRLEQEMSKIIVSCAGWCEADPARTMFQYIGPRDDVEKLISGEQWLSLPEYDEQEVCRDDYAYDHEVEDE